MNKISYQEFLNSAPNKDSNPYISLILEQIEIAYNDFKGKNQRSQRFSVSVYTDGDFDIISKSDDIIIEKKNENIYFEYKKELSLSNHDGLIEAFKKIDIVSSHARSYILDGIEYEIKNELNILSFNNEDTIYLDLGNSHFDIELITPKDNIKIGDFVISFI